MSDNELTIIVQHDAFDLGFDVLITPRSPISGLNREFTSYRKARGYADGVAAVTGWKLIDTVEINQ